MKFIKDSTVKYGETLTLGDFLRLEEDTDGRVLIRVVGAGGGGITLDDLNDVVITTATTNDTLRYNGTNWVNNNFLKNTGSAVIIGTDPGTSNALRIGGAGVFKATEALRLIDDGAYIAFFNTANSTRSGFLQFQTASEAAIGVDVNQPLGFFTNGTRRWQIQAAGHLIAGADNSYNIGGTSNRAAITYSRTYQVIDDVTNGNPYLQFTWKNSGGTQRSGYLEGTADTLRFYSSTLAGAVITMDWANGKVHFNASQAADLYAVNFRRSAGVGTAPDIFGDQTNALVLGGKDDGSGDVKIASTTRFVFAQAAGVIIPGATSLSWRNNADSADNLKILDDGEAFFRNNVALSAGLITVQSEKNAQVKWSTADPSGTPPDGTIWVKY